MSSKDLQKLIQVYPAGWSIVTVFLNSLPVRVLNNFANLIIDFLVF